MELASALQFRARVEDFRRRHRTGVVCLFFSDMVGSTQLKEKVGDERGVALIQSHHATLRATLARFKEAEEISTWGDSFFIVFAKPSDAIRFAVLLQHQLRELSGQAEGQSVRDRMAIHLGEVVVEEAAEGVKPKDLYGLQVDLCARLMELASADQILLSRVVFDSARPVLKGEDIPGLSALSWLSHGRYQFAGVEEPIEICEVGEAEAAPLKAPADTPKARRVSLQDGQEVPGWRPALGQVVPHTHWVLERKLGQGGFGEVWLAVHKSLKQSRVFKFCFRPDRVRWLRREVALFRVLSEKSGEHPNLMRLLNVNLDEPPFYLEMDYCSGGDLRAWCESQGGAGSVPLPVRLELIAQAADALQVAHDSGILHRDIKPGNLLIQLASKARAGDTRPAQPVMKLTDFGVGKIVSSEAVAGLTLTGGPQTLTSSTSSVYTGTLMYLAPELLSGKQASPQSDIYSLGIVLYQFLTEDFGHALTVDWAEAFREQRWFVPVLSKCFAGDPSRRFASAGELAAAIRTCTQEHLTGGHGHEDYLANYRKAWRSETQIQTRTQSSLAEQPAKIAPAHPRSSRKWLAWGGGLALLGTLAAGFFASAFFRYADPALGIVADQILEESPAATSIPLEIKVDRRLRETVKVTPKSENPYVVEVSSQGTGEKQRLGLMPKAVGETTISVTVTDGRGYTTEPVRFGVKVTPKPVPPTLANMPRPVPPVLGELRPITLGEGAQSLTVDLPLTVQKPAVSLAGVDITITVEPRGILSVRTKFTGNTWQAILIPLSAGSATVTLAATDERGLAGKPMSFRANVLPRPVSPVLGELKSLPALEEGGQPVAVDLAVTVQAPIVSLAKTMITPTVEPPGILAASTNYTGGRWQLILTPQKAGSATITLTATDERGLSGNPVKFAVTIQRSQKSVANIARLEQLAVWFGVLKNKDAITADVHREAPIARELYPGEAKGYLQELHGLKSYFNGQSPNPKVDFAVLEKAIGRHQ
jgi:serine/threonine protein kinase/class 3 adenylate cyclase